MGEEQSRKGDRLEHKSPYEQEESNFTRRVGTLRTELAQCSPQILAERTGAVFEPVDEQSGIFHLQLWGQPITISFPDLVVLNASHEPSALVIQALVIYYFHTAHGPAPTGAWISFSELPDGKFYNQAFQGYSGKQLSRAFGNDTTAVMLAARKTGARSIPATQTSIGDFASLFRVLPHLPILLVGWQGDEDFPASYQLLFDVTAANFLPTDVCAIVGGMLVRKIIAARDEARQ
jgi:hypothetical protein